MRKALYLLPVVAFFVALRIVAGSQLESPRHEMFRRPPDGDGKLHPIMRPDPETRRMWIERYNKAPRVSIDSALRPLRGSVDLLGHLSYVPSERDQGYCGNCWAWAGTGVMEIALDVEESTKDRLSIQYLNSCYGTGSDYACCGGWLEDVASFYTGKGRAVAWSNPNASWQDYYKQCSSSASDVACCAVDTLPTSYGISSITAQTITTHGVGQATAIDSIKNVLNQNRAISFSFFLCNDTDWQVFFDFWNNDSESTLFDFDYSCNKPWDPWEGGGHAVLCVGYNDDDPGNRYWIMLNSWGTTAGRPNGLFRVSMDINYDCSDTSPDYNLYWQTLDISFGPTPSPAPTCTPPVPTPTCAPGQTKVLILSPDEACGEMTLLNTALASCSGIYVETWDMASGNPGVADLLGYDVVILGNDCKWTAAGLDKTVIGNNLASYIDQGGKVIEGLYVQSFDDWGFGGRYMTDGYSPLTVASLDRWAADTMQVVDPFHPVMAGVSSANDNWGHQNPGLRSGGSLLAKWSNSGYNYIAVNGNVVALNQLLHYDADWTGDVGTILCNAINYLAPQATPTPAETATPTMTPTMTSTETPRVPLALIPGQIVGGESFALELMLLGNITSPFDYYMFMETPAGIYTICMGGGIHKGLKPLYRNVKKFSAPYLKTIRPRVRVPKSMKGKLITFYAVVVEAGRMPPVEKPSDLTPTTPRVIMFVRNAALVS